MARRVMLAAFVAVCVSATPQCSPTPPDALRVVLITLDTLRLDAFLGGEARASQMPRLGKWAEGGRVFERYYSATSSTQPTHATLFTGLHPWEHGVHRNGAVLVEEQETLAERLKAAGFSTAAAVASFPLHSQFGFAQGFDTYHDQFTQSGAKRWEGTAVPEAHFRSSAEDITATALDLLETARGPRQFFWFHYFDAHAPYGASTGRKADLKVRRLLTKIWEGADEVRILEKARRFYDRDVRYLDEAIDRVMSRLAADAERIETHIVVVSDHGESFGESGSLGHGKRLTLEQIRVPCVVISPRVAPGVSQEPLGTADLTTTILGLAGLDDGAPGGRDVLTSEGSPGRIVGMRRTFQTPYRERRVDGSVHVHDGLRFYVLEGRDLLTGSSQDPVTLNDSADAVADPETTAEARTLFRGFEEAFRRQALHAREDPETLEKLRALGYVR